MKFTIELGTNESVLHQANEQGLRLSRRQIRDIDELDSADLCLRTLREAGILTDKQVNDARKRLLRQMLSVIGGVSRE